MNALPPLLETKLHTPQSRANTVARVRLLDRLRQAERAGQTLVLVSAPAGFGKSTVIAEWAHTLEHASAWLALDAADNDPARFWTYCIAALQTVAPQLGQTILPLVQTAQDVSPEFIVTLLANDFSAPAQTVRLVLDDYHHITNTSIHTAFTLLLDHAPRNFQLILTTRTDPPLPLPRLRARGQMLELRADDLRFTPAEAAEFLNHAMGLPLTAAQIEALDKRTEGWIAGLQLAALSLRGQADAETFIRAFAGSHRYVMDYLVDEVLSQQTPEMQNFLLQTSVLAHFRAELCDAILQRDNSAEQIAALERANLFLVPLDETRAWYRYHHLFAELLQHRLQHAEPAHIAELHQRAAAWFAQNDLPAEAIEHALAARAYADAADLLQTHLSAFQSRGEHATIQHWLGQLPAEWIARNPLLTLALARAFLLEHQLDRAEAHLAQAERALAAEPNASWADRARAESARDRVVLAVFRQDYPRAQALARRALAELELPVNLRAEILQGLALAYNWENEYEKSIEACTQALQLCRAAGEIYEPLSLYSNMAEARALLGQLAQAVQICREGIEYAGAQHLAQAPIAANLHQTLGEVFFKRAEIESAEFHIAQSLALSERGRLSRMQYFAMTMQARLAHAQGEFVRAQEWLDRARAFARQFELDAFLGKTAAYVQVTLWLDTQNLAAAAAWADTITLPAEGPLRSQDLLAYRALVRVRLAQGQADAAQGILERADRLDPAKTSTENKIGLQTWHAITQAAKHNAHAAQEAVERALMLAEPERYIQVFVYTGAALYPLLLQARSRAAGTRARADFIDAILAAFARARLVPTTNAPAVPQKSPDALTEREHQVLKLIAQGKSNQEIAEALAITVATVKKHSGLVYEKLGVKSRTEAILRAQQLGLI